MPSELQRLAERIRTIADQCKGWSVAAGKQADRSRATARRARALRERHRGNPVVLDALVAQLDTAAQENEKTAAGLAQLARMLFEFAAWLALPGGPGKATKRPADLVAGTGVPDAVTAAARRLRVQLPRGGKTVGQLVLDDGQPWGLEIWSGVDGPAQGAPGVRQDATIKPWFIMTAVIHHVEGHAAALLRRTGAPQRVNLVISQDPCEGRNGCANVIPDVLPAGTRVNVYIADEDGTVRPWKDAKGNTRRLDGNGRGLQP